MEKVRIRKIIEDIIITRFLNSEIDIVHSALLITIFLTWILDKI